MEFLVSPTEYLFAKDSKLIRCCRRSGKVSIEQGGERLTADFTCLGRIFGILGCLSPGEGNAEFLLLITGRRHVGQHPFTKKPIYQVERVASVPWKSTDQTVHLFAGRRLDLCNRHRKTSIKNNNPWERSVVQPLIRYASNQAKKTLQSAVLDKLKQDQPLDDVLRLFNDNGCFYYCPQGDLTNSVQSSAASDGPFVPMSERFLWNRRIADGFLENWSPAISIEDCVTQGWLCAIINGHVSIVTEDHFMIAVISRRSIYRAGTRYLRRGLDNEGHCANYVETEQIVRAFDHVSSFVMVRGSVPVFWSQPGYKYRPPPVVLKSKSDTMTAFRKHFDEQVRLYGVPVVSVNLLDPTGSEKPLDDAYLGATLESNDDRLVYVSFNFNAYCRGMRFGNVSVLVKAVKRCIDDMRFCWMDNRGQAACLQSGVFRVNCADCLDRTNVVQTAIAKVKLEEQLMKFGMLLPEEKLSPRIAQAFRVAWANNGDAISRQYAGTDALKGEFTRTGQQNVASMVRDGYRSVNRYYLNHVKDKRRQMAIDLFLGSEDQSEAEEEAEVLTECKVDDMRQLIKDCEQFVVGDSEMVIGSWILLNVSDAADTAMDNIIILTKEAYYVTDYDEVLDKFVHFQKVPLQSITKIEAGLLTMSSTLGIARSKAMCIRISFIGDGFEPAVHTWRSGGSRLFNGIIISITSKEEATENVMAIVEQFRIAFSVANLNIPIVVKNQLERRRSSDPKASGTGSSSATAEHQSYMPEFSISDIAAEDAKEGALHDGRGGLLTVPSAIRNSRSDQSMAETLGLSAKLPTNLSNSCQNFIKKFGNELQQTAQKTVQGLVFKPTTACPDRYGQYRAKVNQSRTTFILL